MKQVRITLFVGATIFACGGTTAVVGDGGAGSSGGSSGSSGSSGNGEGGTRFEGGSSGSSSGSSGGKDASRDANPAGCPATFNAPPGNCTQGLKCSYDQGRCDCEGYCGGVPPPEDIDFTHWSCTPKLDNGCPDDPPQEGTVCKVPTTCTYGACCVQSFTCGDSGKWTTGGIACPP